MFGEPGVDRYGYPRATANKLALRALLAARRFRELTTYIESFQTEFEADFRKEYWPFDAIDAFMTADPAVGALIEQWAEAFPRSFAPWAARAAHEIEVANVWRGVRTIDQVPGVRIAAMQRSQDRAWADTEHALQLRPRLVIAYRQQLTLIRHRSDPVAATRVLDRALEICPLCFQVRVTYFLALRPEWGGSWAAMLSFAGQTLDVAGNPRLAVVGALPDWYTCDRALIRGQSDVGRAACDRAIAIGDHWDFYWARGQLSAQANDYEHAIEDYRRAVEMRPQNLEAERSLSDALARHHDIEEGARVFLDSVRIEPVAPGLEATATWWRRTLDREVARAQLTGRTDDTRRLAQLALELAPGDEIARNALQGAGAAR